MPLQNQIKVLRASTGIVDLLSPSPDVLRIPGTQSHAHAPQTRAESQNDSQELIVATSLAESAISKTSQPRVQTCKTSESKTPSQSTAKATTDANRASEATTSTATPRRRMPSRLNALHELGEQIQGANITTERQQALEALRVVAANDRHIRHYHNKIQVCCEHRDDRIAEKIRSFEVATAREEDQRGAIEQSVPPSTTSQQNHSQHRAPAIVPAIDPRGPQLIRQLRNRRIIASTIAGDLCIVPSNEKTHQEGQQKQNKTTQHRRAPDLSCTSTSSGPCDSREHGAREQAVAPEEAHALEQYVLPGHTEQRQRDNTK